jgi:farnesyl diphosphate synthase
VRTAFEGFAHDLGLCYQIVDDLLDAEGDENLTGKRTHKDDAQGKSTFVSTSGSRARASTPSAWRTRPKSISTCSARMPDRLRACVDYVLARQS